MINFLATLSPARKTATTAEEKLFKKQMRLTGKLCSKMISRRIGKKNWFLDGEKAQLKNTSTGQLSKAGETAANDADHGILDPIILRRRYSGGIRFLKKGRCHKIREHLGLLAEGSGVGV